MNENDVMELDVRISLKQGAYGANMVNLSQNGIIKIRDFQHASDILKTFHDVIAILQTGRMVKIG